MSACKKDLFPPSICFFFCFWFFFLVFFFSILFRVLPHVFDNTLVMQTFKCNYEDITNSVWVEIVSELASKVCVAVFANLMLS